VTVTRGFVRLLVGLTVGIAVVTVLCGCGHQAADRNAAAEQAIRALHTGIAEWTVDHDDGAPAARLVVEATTVPRFDGYPPETVGCYMTSRDPHPWLTNPFTGKPIRQGTSPGDFTYVELADGGNGFTCSAYRLTLYGADSKPLLVEGDDENAWDGAFPTEMTEVNWLIRDWARHHHGVYPPESMVDQAGLGVQYARTVMVGTHVVTFVWPTNPFDGRPLRPGGGPGDYRYRRLGSRRYELIAHDRYGSATRVTQSQSSYWP
jgi:hypothetical protein